MTVSWTAISLEIPMTEISSVSTRGGGVRNQRDDS